MALLLALVLGAGGTFFDLTELLALISQPHEDPAPLVARLESLRAGASPAEKKLITRLVAMLGEQPERIEDVERVLRSFERILRDMEALAPADDVRVQLRLSATRTALAQTVLASKGALRMDAGKLRRESLASVKKLAARFPREARAQGLLGTTLWAWGEDALVALEPIVACLRLDKAEPICAGAYRRIAAAYQEPRCVEFEPGLVAQVARSGDGMTELRGKPFLGDGDFASARARTEEIGGERKDVVVLDLTARGKKRLAQATARLARDGGEVALVLGGRILFTAHVREAITGGSVSVYSSPGAGLTLESLCRGMERQELPERLRIDL